VSEPTTPQPGWYPDPSGRHEHRFHDGAQWTPHVFSGGAPSVDPVPPGPGQIPEVGRPAERIRADATKAGPVRAPAGLHLMDAPVLVVSQKAKLIELSNEYAVHDQDGVQVGAVRQVGQSTAKKVLRFVAAVDQFLTHTLQVVDMQGTVLLQLTRPAKLLRSRVLVQDGYGRPVGEIVQQNVFGKIRFELLAGDVRLGSINAENWRAWNFSIRDADDTEVARITKTWEGLAKTLFTTADNYVVQLHRPLPDPLRMLVVASALSVDTALKQDKRGLG
jgi:uncharacterized protein YxjI